MGLHLQKDGVLNGTPTTEGTSTFRVCAIDLDANQACGSVTHKVRPGARRVAGTWNTQPLSAVCPGGGGTWTGTFTIAGGRLTGVWRDSYSNAEFRVDAPITPDGTATWIVGGGSESITLTGRFGAVDGTVRGTLVGPVCTSVAGRWRGTFQGAAR